MVLCVRLRFQFGIHFRASGQDCQFSQKKYKSLHTIAQKATLGLKLGLYLHYTYLHTHTNTVHPHNLEYSHATTNSAVNTQQRMDNVIHGHTVNLCTRY